MWPVTHTEFTTASMERIWALWEAVERWPEWDEGISSITLDGPFAVGTTGRIRPTGSPSWPFALVEVDAGHSAFFEHATEFNDSVLSFLAACGIRGRRRSAHSNAAGYVAPTQN